MLEGLFGTVAGPEVNVVFAASVEKFHLPHGVKEAANDETGPRSSNNVYSQIRMS